MRLADCVERLPGGLYRIHRLLRSGYREVMPQICFLYDSRLSDERFSYSAFGQTSQKPFTPQLANEVLNAMAISVHRHEWMKASHFLHRVIGACFVRWRGRGCVQRRTEEEAFA